jgi:predicted nucleic acid-binding protein
VTGRRRAVYVDSSALVKLIVTEPESDALRAFLDTEADLLVASRVAEVEVARVLSRVQAVENGTPPPLPGNRLHMIELDGSVARIAGTLPPRTLRSLDAIHLASALALEDELDGFVTYDARLADAALGAGLSVVAPH